MATAWASLLLLIVGFLEFATAQEYKRNGSTIVTANARFQFLTPTLARMEYSPSGSFVDNPSAVVLNRKWKKVNLSVSESDGRLVAKTSFMTIRYRLHSGVFGKEHLKIARRD